MKSWELRLRAELSPVAVAQTIAFAQNSASYATMPGVSYSGDTDLPRAAIEERVYDKNALKKAATEYRQIIKSKKK